MWSKDHDDPYIYGGSHYGHQHHHHHHHHPHHHHRHVNRWRDLTVVRSFISRLLSRWDQCRTALQQPTNSLQCTVMIYQYTAIPFNNPPMHCIDPPMHCDALYRSTKMGSVSAALQQATNSLQCTAILAKSSNFTSNFGNVKKIEMCRLKNPYSALHFAA